MTTVTEEQTRLFNSSLDFRYERPRARFRRYRQRLALIVRNGECWEWNGTLNASGYGVTAIGGARRNRKNMPAHRWVYEQFVGEIPQGLFLDHLCRNTRCVAPSHLEPVTAAENTRRWLATLTVGTHTDVCRHGHAMTPENTYVRTKKFQPGSRECRTCHREQVRKLRHEKQAKRLVEETNK